MNILAYESTQETKAHGDPGFPFNIYPCSIPLDFTAVPTHWHNDMEIIYIKKGSGRISVDLVSYQVQAGAIAFIAPGQLHAIEQSENTIMEYENIIFQLSMLMPPGSDLCNEQFFTPLLHNRIALPTCLLVDAPAHREVSRCLNEIDHLSSRGDPVSALGIKGKLLELFYLLFCQYGTAASIRPRSKSLDNVKVILKQIETHYQDKLTIEDMARLCGFSCSHFMKFFKQQMGMSFIEYLNDYRLTMAARMLSASADTVVSVAQEAGFENLSYFNRMFKRKFNMTPSQYRQ